jgi:hypothetical protein
MRKKYLVKLSSEQRGELERLVTKGESPARKLTHARILLKADSGSDGPGWTDRAIREALDIDRTTVEQVRKVFAQEGLEAALKPHRPRREYRRRLDGRAEAHLIALACGAPPEGRQAWTLRVLADRMVELAYVDRVSHETVRQVLKKRPEAVAEEELVHSARGERGVRGRPGGCPGCLCAAL